MDYSHFVAAIAKPDSLIRESLALLDGAKIHAALGVTSEAGEIATIVKAEVVYRKPVDREHLIEELGDIEWFLEHLRQCYNLNRDDIIRANMAKLSKRYPQLSYSDKDAIARADKAT